MMLPLKYKLSRNILETIYMVYVRPILEYGDVIFDNCTDNLKSDLENNQIGAAQIVTGAKGHTSHALLYKETGWSTLCARRQTHKLIILQQLSHDQTLCQSALVKRTLYFL